MDRKYKSKQAPLITALESRVLLDGAMAVDAAQAWNSNDYTEQRAEQSDKAPLPVALAPREDNRRELVFIDASLPDYQTLVDGVDTNALVYLIQNHEDGFTKIADILDGQTDIDAIHIFGHGAAGEASLGNAILNADTFNHYSSTLYSIGSALTANGDILLYGCNIAADSSGEHLVEQLAQITQADIAASNDLTGSANLGGDWELEKQSGQIDTDELEPLNYQHTLATGNFVVSSSVNSSASETYSVTYDASGGFLNPGSGAGTDRGNAASGASETLTITVSGLAPNQPWTIFYDASSPSGTPSTDLQASNTAGHPSYSGVGNGSFTTSAFSGDGSNTDLAIWVGAPTATFVISSSANSSATETYNVTYDASGGFLNPGSGAGADRGSAANGISETLTITVSGLASNQPWTLYYDASSPSGTPTTDLQASNTAGHPSFSGIGNGSFTTNAFNGDGSNTDLAIWVGSDFQNDAPSFTPLVGGFGSTDGGATYQGFATTDVTSGPDIGTEMLVLSDGKILQTGYANDYVTLVRYNSDGTLDNTYGTNGIVTTSYQLINANWDISIAQQSSGKVIVAFMGTNAGYGSQEPINVARFNTDGSVDTSFGNNGIKVFTAGTSSTFPESVLVDANDKILVGGHAYTGSEYEMFVARLTADGNLDSSFSSDGKAYYNYSSSATDHSFGMTLDRNGKILLSGAARDRFYAAVVRFNTNGTLDTTFGTSNVAAFNAGSNEYAIDIVALSDGKILYTGIASDNVLIARLTEAGALDTSFNTTGYILEDLGGTDQGRQIAVQSDGKVIVAGETNTNGVREWFVRRYNTDGSLDTTFGTQGMLTHQLYTTTDKEHRMDDMEILSDDSIILSGSTYTTGDDNYGYSLMKLTKNGSLYTQPLNTLDSTPSYIENGTAFTLDNDVVIRDPELDLLNGGSGDYAGASLTIVRNGGASTNDVFSLDSTGTNFTVSGGNLQVGGQTFATFTAASGTFAINFTSSGATATTALVNEVMQHIQYSNSSHTPNSSVQLDWTFNDGNSGAQGAGGAGSDAGSITVSITAVNDVPVSSNSSKSGTEDTTLTFVASDFVGNYVDADSDSLTKIQITALPTNGTLKLSGSSISLNDEIAVADLGNISYHPDTNWHGSVSFDWKGHDGTEYAQHAATLTINIAAVSEAPEFTSGAILSLVTPNTSNPPGDSVSSLFGLYFNDNDNDNLAGIAIGANAADATTEGSWQYSSDGGANWFDVGVVANSTALLLDATTKLRFVPVSDYTGRPGSLNVFAVDDSVASSFSNGNTRETFDTTADAATSQVAVHSVVLVTDIGEQPFPFQITSNSIGQHINIKDHTTDSNNNYYVTGTFYNYVKLHASDSNAIIEIDASNAAYNDYNTFIAKYDANGNLIWGTWMSGESAAIAANDNGVYLAATYDSQNADDTLTFGDGSTTSLTSYTSDDALLYKIGNDASDTTNYGKLQWVSAWGTTGSDNLYDIDLDANGNVYVVGQMYGKAVSDNDTGWAFANYNESRYGALLAKFDDAGDLVWEKRWRSAVSNGNPGFTSLDVEGNYVYAAGRFYDQYYKTPNSTSNNYDSINSWNGMLTKVGIAGADDGVVKWNSTIVSGNASSGVYANAIVADGNHVYVGGRFTGTAFVNGGGILGSSGTASSGWDAYVAKFNDSDGATSTTGGYYLRIQSSSTSSINDLELDSDGYLYASFEYYHSSPLSVFGTTLDHTTQGRYGVAKFDTADTFNHQTNAVWVKAAQYKGNITINGQDELFYTGIFNGTDKDISLGNLYERYTSAPTSSLTSFYNDGFVYKVVSSANPDSPNNAPTLSSVATLTGATEDVAFTITHSDLIQATNAADADTGASIGFLIDSLTTGSLSINGEPVVVGETRITTGQSVVWTPAADSNGIQNAFTIKAHDGIQASASAVQVQVAVSAVDDAPRLPGLSGQISHYPFGGFEYVKDVVYQADGKILVAGYVNNDLFIARYKADGSFDNRFANGGVFTYDTGRNDNSIQIAVDAHGNIYFAGFGDYGDDDILVVGKLNSQGQLLTSFSGDGIDSKQVVTDLGMKNGVANHHATELLLDEPNDRLLLVVKEYDNGANSGVGTAIAQWRLSDGAYQTTTKLALGTYAQATGASFDQQGRLVVVGRMTVSGYSSSDMEGFIARFSYDGTHYVVDTSFDAADGSAGWKMLSLGNSYTYTEDVMVDRISGKYLVVGRYMNSGYPYISRYNTNGSLDTSFGNNGWARIDLSSASTSDSFTNIVQQADGKIVVLGFNYDSSLNKSFGTILRYTHDGQLDTQFATDGQFHIREIDGVGGSNLDLAHLVLDTDDNILVARSSGGVLMAKILADGSGYSPDFGQPANPAQLTSSAINASSPNGDTIANLFASTYSDPEGDAFTGIAIASNLADSSLEGSWQYSTDSGNTWFNVGAVSSDQALLLEKNAKLRFVAIPNWGGQPGLLAVHAVSDSISTSFTSADNRLTFDTTADAVDSQVSIRPGYLTTEVTSIYPILIGGETNSEYLKDITWDPGDDSYIYATGYFRDTIDFAPNGVVTSGYYSVHTSHLNGTRESSYVAKYERLTGKLVWVFTWGDDSGGARAQAIAYQESHNYLVVGGSFDGDITVNGTTKSSTGNEDMFIFRLRASDGTTTTGLKVSGTASKHDRITDIAVDGSGNIYAIGETGYSNNFSLGGSNNNNSQDVAIFKFNFSLGTLYARYWGGAYSDYAGGVSVSNDGNYVAVASTVRGYQSTSDYAGTVKVFNSSNMSERWTANFARERGNGEVYAFDVAFDSSHDVYVTGKYAGRVDFDDRSSHSSLKDNTTDTGTTITDRDAYLVKLDINNGNPLGVQTISGSGDAIGYELYIDGNDYVYVGGSNKGIVNFGSKSQDSGAKTAAFLAKYYTNASGLIWGATTEGGNYTTLNVGILVTSNNDLYAAGNYKGLVDLNLGKVTDRQQSTSGGNDGFITSLTPTENRIVPNYAPTLTSVATLTGGTEDVAYNISYSDLANASDAADADGDPIYFLIDSLLNGSLTLDGLEILTGVTKLVSGQVLAWTPAANSFGTVSAFKVRAHDGEDESTTAIDVKVELAGVDDVPVFSSNSSVTIAEGQTAATTVVATDADGDAISYSLVGSDDDQLFSVNANSGALVFNTAPDYENPIDSNGDNDYLVTVRATTATAAIDQTITISVINTNDAPVAIDQTLTNITEDINTASNAGTAVADLVAGNTDGDDIPNGSSDQRGIAITSLDTSNGSWEYSTDGGSNWHSLATVSSSSARLLAADNSNHRVRFVPNQDYSGSASFTFRAWDQETGTAGSTANVSTNGNATAYSANEGAASITVTAVNDVPVVSNLNDFNMVKDINSEISLSASDVDGDSLTWSVSVAGANAGDITATIVNGSTLRLVPDAGISGPYNAGDITVTVSANDGNGGVANESFDILRINSAPVLTSISDVTLTEDQANATVISLTSTDPEGDAVTYSVTGGSASSIVASIDGSNLSLMPAENFYTTGTPVTLTVTAHDVFGATHSQSFDVSVTAANEAPSFTAVNATGNVDSGFGTTGAVTTSVSAGHDYAYDMLLQADGKTLVAGYNSGGKFSLVRYLDNGNEDPSFGTNGVVVTSRTIDKAKVAIVEQADGKIIAIASRSDDIYVMRFNADGSLDTTFSGDGFISYDWGGSSAEVGRVLVQDDGKILVAGDIYKPRIGGRNGSYTYRDDWVVMRLLSNGNLDSSFGNSGYWVHNSGYLDYDSLYDMALQDDGKIVVVGAFDANSSSRTNFSVARLNTNGTLDTSFSGDGLQEINLGNYDYAYAVHIQADGKILLAGEKQDNFAIARLNSNGSIDTSFSGDGSLVNNLGANEEIYDITTQADGKILVAGKTNSTHHGSSYYGFTVVRYNEDGTLDTSFAGDGVFKYNFHNSNKHSYARALQVVGNGDIIVSGYTQAGNTSNYDFASLRLNSAGELVAAPVATLNGTPAYTENGTAVVLDADVAIFENDLSVLNNGNGDFAGGSLTIARNGGASANDVFSINTSSTGFTDSSGNLQTGGNTFATWSQTSGTLTINFTSTGTAATTALVNEVMRNIFYANSSENPTTSVQLDWTFNDGNSGNQGSGGALVGTGSTTVTITPVNDAPTLIAIPDQTKAEGASPWTIDLSNYGSDAEGNSITYTVATSENGTYGTSAGTGVQASIAGSILTLTVNDNFSNDASPLVFWIKASDGSLMAKTSFNVTIAGINEAPEFGAGDGVYLDSRIDSSVGDIKAMVELPDGDLLLSYMENSYNKLVRIGGDGTVVDYRTSIASANDILVNNGVDQYTLFGTKFDTTWDISKGYAGSFDVEANNLLSNTSNTRNIKSGFDNDSYDTYYPVSTAYQKDAMNNYLLVAAIDFTDPTNSNYKDPYVTLNRYKQWSNTAIADSTANDRAGVMISTDRYAAAETKDIIVDAINSYAYVITRQNYTDTYRNNYGIGIHKFSLGSSSISYVTSATFDPVPNINNEGVSNTTIKAYMAADGGIYLGYTNEDTHDNELVKLTSNLAVDTSFGTNGVVNLDNTYGNSYIGEFNGIQVQSDGKILFAATAGSGNTTSPGGVSTQDVQIALGRLNTDGSIDTSFSGNGYVLSSELPGVVRTHTYNDSQILIDANGNINWAFVAVDPDQNNKKQIVIARFDSAGNLDSDFNATGALNGLPTFVEDSAAVKLDTDVALADSELNQLNGGSGDYAGASLTISRNSGAVLEDRFSFDTSGASFTVSANNLLANGKNFASFTNTSGSLVINFTSGATKATTALVNNVMQHITYANSSDNPPSSVQLDWSFNDGGADGRQGTGGGLAATGSTTVSITAINDAPSFSVADQTIAEDQAGTITLNATDPEGEAVTYAIQTAGSAATVEASLSGNVLTLTPAANYNGGPVNISVRATDASGAYTDQTFAVSVTAVNDAPTVDMGSTQLQTERTSGNTNASFYIDSLSVADVEDQSSGNVTVVLSSSEVNGSAYGTLTLATNVANGVRASEVQNNGNGSITVTSTIARINTTLGHVTGLQYAANSGMDFVAKGADLITMKVTDTDGVSATGTRQVFVLPAKPTANSKNYTINEDGGNLNIDLSALVTSFNGTGDDYALGANTSPNQVSASDGSGGALTSTWAEANFSESLSLGTLADDSANTFDDGQFVYTPNANANGVETFLYQFTDSGGNTEVAQINIYVLAVNDTPVLGAIGNQTLTEDTPKTIALTATDVEGEVITYSVTGGSTATVAATVVGNQLTFTPAADYETSTPISFTITATDASGATDTETITLVVNPVADDPRMSAIAAQTLTEDTPTRVLLDAYDPDGTAISYSLVDDGDASSVQASLNGNAIILTPAANYHGGPVSITVRATDASGATIDRSFDVNVSSVNDNPVLAAISDQVLTEDTVKTINLSATDVENDVVSYSVTGGNSNTIVASVSDSTLTLTPANDYYGSNPISFTVTATDANGGTHSRVFRATVNAVNDAPSITAIADQVMTEDTGHVVNLSVSDAENDAYSLSVSGGSSDTVSAQIAGNQLLLTPATNYNTSTPITFTITAEDIHGESTTSTVKVTVAGVNDAPVNVVSNSNLVTERTTDNPTAELLVDGFSVTDIDDTHVTVVFSTKDMGGGDYYGDLTIKTDVVGGVSASDVSNNGTGQVTISSTLAKISVTLDHYAGIVYVPDNGRDFIATGVDVITMTTTDDDGASHTVTRNVYVLPAAPTANSKNYAIDEDHGAYTINLQDLVIDLNQSAPDFVLADPSAGSNTVSNSDGTGGDISTNWSADEGTFNKTLSLGTLADDTYGVSDTFDEDGTFVYTTNANANGVEKFLYQYSSSGESSEVAQIAIYLLPVNDAPTLTDVTDVTFTEDTLNGNNGGGAAQLLDSAVTFADVDGLDFDTAVLTIAGVRPTETLSVQNQAVASSGNIQLSGGNLQVSDGSAWTTIGSLSGGAGNTLRIAFNAQATATNVDAVLQAITYHSSSEVGESTHALTFKVTDGDGADTGDQQINVTVTSVNDAPELAVVGNQLVNQGELLTVQLSATDREGDNLSYAVTGGSQSTVAAALNGNSLTFTQGAGYLGGSINFTVTVTDENGATDTETITFRTNYTPVAVDDAVALNEGASAHTASVVSNDTDGDTSDAQTITHLRTGSTEGQGTAISLGVAYAGTYGSLTLNANGSYTYTLDNANQAVAALALGETLTESFNYTVKDSNYAVDSAVLTFTINGVNDTPVALADTATAVDAGGINNATLAQPATGNVISNDNDDDASDTLTVSAIRAGSTLGSGSAGSVGSAFVGTYGTLTMAADGSYTYRVDTTNSVVDALVAGDTVTESFNYTLSDNNSATADALLTITIQGVNETPDLAVVAAQTLTDTSGDDSFTDITGTLTATDADTGATQTYSIAGQTAAANTLSGVTYDQMKAGDFGTLYLNSSTGVYRFVADDAALEGAKTDAQEQFSFVVTDGTASSSQVLKINRVATNDTPVLSASLASHTYTDTANDDTWYNVNGSLTSTDRDANETATYSIVGQSSDTSLAGYTHSLAGSYGTLYINATTGVYAFAPDDSAIEGLPSNATETFTLRVADASGAQVDQSFTVNLMAVNDKPELSASLEATTFVDTPDPDSFTNVTGSLTTIDRDVGATQLYSIDGQSADTSVVGYDNSKAGTYGTLYINSSTGAYQFVPDNTVLNGLPSGANIETFTLKVSDGGLTDQKTLTIYAVGATDQPIITEGGDAETITESNTGLTSSGTMKVVDVDFTDEVRLTTSVAISGSGSLVLSNADALAMLTVSPTTVLSNATDVIETINWAFNSGSTTFDGLDVGTQLILTYTLTATDTGTPALFTTDTVTVTITGTNDGPTLSSVTSVSYTDTSGDDSHSNVTGQLQANDLDINASLTYSIAGQQADTSVTGFTHSIVGSYGSLYINSGTGAYVYVPNDGAIEALTSTASENFSFSVSDGLQTATQVLNVALTGVNDAPEISANVVTKTYMDTSATDSFSTLSGTLITADRDAGATQLYSLINGVMDSSINGYSHSVTGTYGVMYVNAVTGAYQYVPNDAAINALSGGSVSETFTLQVSDGSATDQQVITIKAIGLSDTPIVAAGGQEGINETNAGVTGQGSFTVSDMDLTDAVNLTTSLAVSGTGTVPVSHADLLQMFSLNSATVLSNNSDVIATVNWNFNSGNSVFNELATGETLVLTYTVTATDTGTPALTSNDTVTVTITGTNDQPTLTSNRVADVIRIAGESHTQATSQLFTDIDGSGDTRHYSAQNLPTGLSINHNTGLITGQATRPGGYNVVVTMKDRANTSVSAAAFRIEVLAPALVPTSDQPATKPTKGDNGNAGNGGGLGQGGQGGNGNNGGKGGTSTGGNTGTPGGEGKIPGFTSDIPIPGDSGPVRGGDSGPVRGGNGSGGSTGTGGQGSDATTGGSTGTGGQGSDATTGGSTGTGGQGSDTTTGGSTGTGGQGSDTTTGGNTGNGGQDGDTNADVSNAEGTANAAEVGAANDAEQQNQQGNRNAETSADVANAQRGQTLRAQIAEQRVDRVDVNVGRDGQVRIAQTTAISSDVSSGLIIVEVSLERGLVNLEFADFKAGQGTSYNVSLPGGDAIPEWLDFNAVTGELTGIPPVGIKSIDLVIEAVDEDGESRYLEITVDFDLQATDQAQVDQAEGPGLLSKQIQQVQDQRSHYGSELIEKMNGVRPQV